jgi:hypothetical protein
MIGRDAILHLAAGDEVADKSGLFFNGMREAQANPQAYDEATRKRLRTPAGLAFGEIDESEGSNAPRLHRSIGKCLWNIGSPVKPGDGSCVRGGQLD